MTASSEPIPISNQPAAYSGLQITTIPTTVGTAAEGRPAEPGGAAEVAPLNEASPLKAALWKLASAITPFTRLKSMRVAPVRSRRMLFQKRELGGSVD